MYISKTGINIKVNREFNYQMSIIQYSTKIDVYYFLANSGIERAEVFKIMTPKKRFQR